MFCGQRYTNMASNGSVRYCQYLTDPLINKTKITNTNKTKIFINEIFRDIIYKLFYNGRDVSYVFWTTEIIS